MVAGNDFELLRLEMTAERRHSENMDQKFDELNTELTGQTTEFLAEMRK